jgi:predicted negative regulator of RcsB-dependent stress response
MNQEQEIQVISERIAKTEMARALIEAGKFDKALEMLYKIKDSYQEPERKRTVQHMIDETLKKKSASQGIIEKITGRFRRPKL